jgi:hypothetical protein
VRARLSVSAEAAAGSTRSLEALFSAESPSGLLEMVANLDAQVA